ncbi:DUF4304 domain-containing protein [Moheibacter sediminis]|uniref:DUF4304 domain-containing protein n=1 Tax=Moheibacter sediminis TaxID=1434700 RepID=A0A1W1ZKC6_9FLAO|nr:DUF4304 domain-containing protein [Moheibacter sediminis]SMC48683.1 protein of unknown function [Moheibacter sediminis]
MDSKEFKKLFGEVAKSNGFESAFGGWFKDSAESIVVLDLQKSNFGDYYEMNIKIFIQGMFGNSYSRSKDLVKRDIGNIFTRQPPEYKSVFDFDEPMDDEKRKEKLEQLFSKFIVPFSDKALSKSGIRELAEKGEITLLPAVKEELA